jgi:hypothetical protein
MTISTHMASVRGAAASKGVEAGDGGDGGEVERMVLEVSLWRANTLTACIEVDKQLEVVRADDAAGLIFGVEAKLLVKHDCRRWPDGARHWVKGTPTNLLLCWLFTQRVAFLHSATFGCLSHGLLQAAGPAPHS